jgi:hypothetical protein
MQINSVQWLSLPMPTRQRLIELFDIKRSGFTIVEDNVVRSDGHNDKDLAVITVEKMQEYLMDTVETDYFALFRRILLSIKEEQEAKDEEVIISTNDIPNETETKETKQDESSSPSGTSTKRRTNKKEKES